MSNQERYYGFKNEFRVIEAEGLMRGIFADRQKSNLIAYELHLSPRRGEIGRN